jgi:hypothetical protein
MAVSDLEYRAAATASGVNSGNSVVFDMNLLPVLLDASTEARDYTHADKIRELVEGVARIWDDAPQDPSREVNVMTEVAKYIEDQGYDDDEGFGRNAFAELGIVKYDDLDHLATNIVTFFHTQGRDDVRGKVGFNNTTKRVEWVDNPSDRVDTEESSKFFWQRLLISGGVKEVDRGSLEVFNSFNADRSRLREPATVNNADLVVRFVARDALGKRIRGLEEGRESDKAQISRNLTTKQIDILARQFAFFSYCDDLKVEGVKEDAKILRDPKAVAPTDIVENYVRDRLGLKVLNTVDLNVAVKSREELEKREFEMMIAQGRNQGSDIGTGDFLDFIKVIEDGYVAYLAKVPPVPPVPPVVPYGRVHIKSYIDEMINQPEYMQGWVSEMKIKQREKAENDKIKKIEANIKTRLDNIDDGSEESGLEFKNGNPGHWAERNGIKNSAASASDHTLKVLALDETAIAASKNSANTPDANGLKGDKSQDYGAFAIHEYDGSQKLFEDFYGIKPTTTEVSIAKLPDDQYCLIASHGIIAGVIPAASSMVFISQAEVARMKKQVTDKQGEYFKHYSQVNALHGITEILSRHYADLDAVIGGYAIAPRDPSKVRVRDELLRLDGILGKIEFQDGDPIGWRQDRMDVAREELKNFTRTSDIFGNRASMPKELWDRLKEFEEIVGSGGKITAADKKLAAGFAAEHSSADLKSQIERDVLSNAFALDTSVSDEFLEKYKRECGFGSEIKEQKDSEDDLFAIMNATISCPVSGGGGIVINKPDYTKGDFVNLKRQHGDGRANLAQVAFVGDGGNGVVYIHVPGTNQLYIKVEKAAANGFIDGKEVKAGDVIISEKPVKKEGTEGVYTYTPIDPAHLDKETGASEAFDRFSVKAVVVGDDGITDTAVMFKGKVCCASQQGERIDGAGVSNKIDNITGASFSVESIFPVDAAGNILAAALVDLEDKLFDSDNDFLVEKGFRTPDPLNNGKFTNDKLLDVGRVVIDQTQDGFRILLPIYSIPAADGKKVIIRGKPVIETVTETAQGKKVTDPYQELTDVSSLNGLYKGINAQQYFKKVIKKAKERDVVIVAEGPDGKKTLQRYSDTDVELLTGEKVMGMKTAREVPSTAVDAISANPLGAVAGIAPPAAAIGGRTP